MTEIRQGHVLDLLAKMLERSVHCMVTSIPYWGLRDYKLPPMVWQKAGSAEGPGKCEHEWRKLIHDPQPHGDDGSKAGIEGGTGGQEATRIRAVESAFCAKCGAWRGSLGLEPSPELFVEHVVEVFQAMRWVLRDDGCVWLNVGDSYAGSGRGCGKDGKDYRTAENSPKQMSNEGSLIGPPQWAAVTGYKSGDLMMMPFRVASALQTDGWYVRSAIVWAKGVSFRPEWSGAVMPESVNGARWERHRINVNSQKKRDRIAAVAAGGNVGMRNHSGTDYEQEVEWRDCPGCAKCSPHGGFVLKRGSWRPTSAYEMVFMLTKSARYYADREAVAEVGAIAAGTLAAKGSVERAAESGVNARPAEYAVYSGTRNLRNVWCIPTSPFPEAHFATFPEALVEPCIKASTSPYNCAKCGTPWARVVERTGHINQREPAHAPHSAPTKTDSTGWAPTQGGTLGWLPTCECAPFPSAPVLRPEGTAPALVLDPFAGSGTVGVVCQRLGRDFIGLELSKPYCEMARRRLAKPQTLGMFT